MFSFPISISPHTSVKCKINLLAAKIKLISKQWREQRQSAALPRKGMRVHPSLNLYMILIEMTNKNRLNYSEEKINLKNYTKKKNGNKYVTQNVLKLVYPSRSPSYFGLVSDSRIWLKGTSVFLEILSMPRTLGPECLWEPGLVLGNCHKFWRLLREKITFYSKTFFLPLNWFYLFLFSLHFEIS